jgi:NTP pyrophosphatase (non-canonical NTP hydrolase)
MVLLSGAFLWYKLVMKDLQQKVREFVKKYNLQRTPEVRGLDLASEVGELVKEILKTTDYGTKERVKREEIKGELGDILYVLITLANDYDVDLEQALQTVLQKYDKRLSKGSPSSENE